MCTFLPIEQWHLSLLKPVSVHTEEHRALVSPHGASLLQSTMGLTAWHGTVCIAAAGVYSIWPGRSEAWALFGEGSEAHVTKIVKRMRYVLDRQRVRRLEMIVKVSNVTGHKLARVLGFNECSSVLRGYHPDGDDCVMYARIM